MQCKNRSSSLGEISKICITQAFFIAPIFLFLMPYNSPFLMLFGMQVNFWRCELLLRGLCCANTSCALKPPPYFLCIWLGFMSLWLCESEMTMQLNSLYYSFAGKRFSKYDEDLSVGGINEKELNSMNKHIPGNYNITMCEIHRKSLIQHCERSELLLHSDWTKIT